jgi:hypothetical protein
MILPRWTRKCCMFSMRHSSNSAYIRLFRSYLVVY